MYYTRLAYDLFVLALVFEWSPCYLLPFQVARNSKDSSEPVIGYLLSNPVK